MVREVLVKHINTTNNKLSIQERKCYVGLDCTQVFNTPRASDFFIQYNSYYKWRFNFADWSYLSYCRQNIKNEVHRSSQLA